MKDYIDIWFNDACILNGEIWFASGINNGLYKAGICGNDITCVGTFQKENSIGKHLYSSMGYYDGCFCFIPAWAEQGIAFYSIDDDEFTYNGIFQKGLPSKHNQYDFIFWGKIQLENVLYAFGYAYPLILSVDIETREVNKTDLRMIFSEYGIVCPKYFFGKDICEFDNKLFAVVDENSTIFEYDINENNGKFWKIGIKETVFKTIQCIEDIFFLADTDGNIFKWQYGDENVGIEYCSDSGESEYSFSMFLDERLVLFPLTNEKIIFYDRVKKCVKKMQLEGQEKSDWWNGDWGVRWAKKIGQDLLVFSGYTSFLYQVGKESRCLRNFVTEECGANVITNEFYIRNRERVEGLIENQTNAKDSSFESFLYFVATHDNVKCGGQAAAYGNKIYKIMEHLD